MSKFVSKSPYSGQVHKEFDFISSSDLEKKIQRAHEGYIANKHLDIKQRAAKLLKIAEILESDAKKYAEIITKEMGKTITQAMGEVKKSAGHARYFAENLEKLLEPEKVNTEGKETKVLRQPLGVVYQITPFNFPIWLPIKGGLPMIAAGNAVLHRNSHSTPMCGLALEELFQKAGFDAGEFQNVFTTQDNLEDVMKNPKVVGVEFTGGRKAGARVAEVAGKNLKKSVLELGGSDPFVVLNDADLKKAADEAISTRFDCAGQVCSAGKRFIVQTEVFDQFVELVIEKLKNFKVGDPFKEETQLGPLARNDLVKTMKEQFSKAVKQGAKVLYDAGDLNLDGGVRENFFSPKVLEVFDTKNVVMQEETFGPLMPIIKVKDIDEALKVANDSEYGLGSTIFTANDENADKFAREVECGMVFINSKVKSDSKIPFGGVKTSGYGRCSGVYGFHEFTNIKPTWKA